MKALNIKEMALQKGKKYIFFIKRSMKATKTRFHQSLIAFSEYSSNRKICIITTINHYLEIITDIRITDQLIISYKNT